MVKVKSLYLNLMDDKKVVMNNIHSLTQKLEQLFAGLELIEPEFNPIPIKRATDISIYERLQELRGETVKFKTTQLASEHTSDEILSAIEGLSIQINHAGVEFIKPGEVFVKDLGKICYDTDGRIINSASSYALDNLPVLEVIAGICKQDFGLVIQRGATLIYLYGSARFEKTPKHVKTGFDYFLGEDFYEWHRRIPYWGDSLEKLFRQLYLNFKMGKLDSFIVDLKGRHSYTNNEVVVQRYERDYALPLKTSSGQVLGLTVFADSLFKNVDNKLNPFEGGTHLVIDSPVAFHEHFQLVENEQLQHHPFGMRNENGELPNVMRAAL